MGGPRPRGRVLGWGLTEHGRLATFLRSKEVALLDPADSPISDRLRGRWSELVVTDGDDGGLCQGDSGGPLESIETAPDAGPVPPSAVVGVISRTTRIVNGERVQCRVGAAVPSWRALAFLREAFPEAAPAFGDSG